MFLFLAVFGCFLMRRSCLLLLQNSLIDSRQNFFNMKLVSLLLSFCAAKPHVTEPIDVRVYSTVPIARHVTASVIEKEQTHEGYSRTEDIKALEEIVPS